MDREDLPPVDMGERWNEKCVEAEAADVLVRGAVAGAEALGRRARFIRFSSLL
jgi:hypothetical protein